jgi:hypothetical protein
VRNETVDQPFFIPAESPNEAIARIFALTGAQAQGRGEKRALLALRDALGVDVDVARTNAVLGARLAEALSVPWRAEDYTIRNKVNLAGLNVLLEAAAQRYQLGALAQVRATLPQTLTGPQWQTFSPAVSKIEAVTRIAGLTGAPAEWLGPGSKEHKSALTNLADRLLPGVEVDRSSKTRLGRSLAHRLDVQWTDACYSTGETISLEGLNTILAGAERRSGRLGVSGVEMLATPEAEGAALAAALNDGWKAEAWEARRSIEWMLKEGVRGANENEWQGWYFEARGREVLNSAFPPNRRPVRAKYGNTTFDYSLNYVWDLKAHTEEQVFPVSKRRTSGHAQMILNDEAAIRACVAEQGLGFLTLGGSALMDEDREFVAWHRAFKAAHGVRSARSNSGLSRLRKAFFTPLHVEAFWIANSAALDAAVASGSILVQRQGRQPPRRFGEAGAQRRTKMAMQLTRARAELQLARRDWKQQPPQP